ncbi:hypothetical protein HDV01_006541 [Terramyces sp. JEL0728]|nr:hypothetical protein HDV01_006541 [Terramyces sp. JEL0728]
MYLASVSLLVSFIHAYCNQNHYCVYGSKNGSSAIITVHSAAKGWSAIGNGQGMLNSDLFVVFKDYSGDYSLVQSRATAFSLPVKNENPSAKIVDLAVPSPSWAGMAYSFSVPVDLFNRNYFSFAGSDKNPQGDYTLVRKHDFAETVKQDIFIHSEYLPHGVTSTVANAITFAQTTGNVETAATRTTIEYGYAAYPDYTTTPLSLITQLAPSSKPTELPAFQSLSATYPVISNSATDVPQVTISTVSSSYTPTSVPGFYPFPGQQEVTSMHLFNPQSTATPNVTANPEYSASQVTTNNGPTGSASQTANGEIPEGGNDYSPVQSTDIPDQTLHKKCKMLSE